VDDLPVRSILSLRAHRLSPEGCYLRSDCSGSRSGKTGESICARSISDWMLTRVRVQQAPAMLQRSHGPGSKLSLAIFLRLRSCETS
jgi:hypothetical protein